MRIAETFECKIIDEYGMAFPKAIAVILDGHIFQDTGFHAEDIGSEFVFSDSVGGITYEVMYYYGAEYVGKFKSRPLKIKDGEGFTTAIPVDMEHPESVRVQASDISRNEKIINLTRLDLLRRFKEES